MIWIAEVVSAVLEGFSEEIGRGVHWIGSRVRRGLFGGGRIEKMNGKEFGIWAEEAAGRYLEREGMRVLARNYRVKCGELDLVAQDGEMVVFVEVKAIHGVDGEPELKVNAEKRRKLIATAKSFIGQYELYERPARFDVVTVQVDQKGKPVIRHEQDVFQAE